MLYEVYMHGQILGTHIGTEIDPMLRDFYKDESVDLSSLLGELVCWSYFDMNNTKC